MAKLNRHFSIGADPEIALRAASGFVPAWEHTKGTKSSPVHAFNTDYGGVSVHADGVAYELNLPPVELGSGAFSMVVRQALQGLHDLNFRGKAIEWEAVVSAPYSSEVLEHPVARAIGCSEDFDAYSQTPTEARVPPSLASFGQTRYFGGHLHLGYPLSICPQHHVVARFCDLYISLPAIEAGLDAQGSRRNYYGMPGIFRPKSYGIEYRTPSNFWMARGEAHFRTQVIEGNAYNMLCLLRGNKSLAVSLYNSLPWGAVAEAIRSEDSAAARTLLEPVRAELTSKLGPYSTIRQFTA